MPITDGIAYEWHGGRRWQGRPPLLLIHGSGGTRLDWPASLRRLPGVTVAAIDLPGHGDSAGEPLLSVEAYRARVLEWMDALVIDQAIWAGHSMGSAIALSAALDRPDRVAALVLVGSGGRLRVHPSFLEQVQTDSGLPLAVDVLAAACFGPDSPRQLVAGWRGRARTSRALRYDLTACDRFDVMDRLADITCPTLIMCGAEDQMTPPKYAAHLAKEIGGSRQELIPGAGHMVMLERPQEVTGSVRGFLEGLRLNA